MSLGETLASALRPGWALRERTDQDLAFLAALYADTREEELRPVPWTPQQKAAFLHDQFRSQHAHYLQHYPDAHWWMLLCDDQPAGRLYVRVTGRELRLMDISLLAQHRGSGAGSAVLRALAQYCDAQALEATLYVEPFNPALRLYRRMGFQAVETQGLYLFMSRPTAARIAEIPAPVAEIPAS